MKAYVTTTGILFGLLMAERPLPTEAPAWPAI